jgi:geranylgeranyl diphosphate synthase type I
MPPFKEQLEHYKRMIDADIAAYSDDVRKTAREQYGVHGALVTDAFLDLLNRGGKRIRGSLVMIGYAMCGGRDQQMIVRAARALEIIHAHLLIIDDIQDRSKLRRGRPTVHEMLAAYHKKQTLRGDSVHTGTSLALNAAFAGNAAAQALLAGLEVDDELKIKVLGVVNMTIVTTAQGQTQDIFNEVAEQVGEQDIENTMEWKTANYTLLNPLCAGMVLAGASCEDTDAIRDYAIPAGKAFQITDDIISTFGDSKKTGKSDMDDIREGKQTLLTLYALEHAGLQEQAFLRQCLGSDALTPADFVRCQQILKDSGALSRAESRARQYIDQALTALEHTPAHWGNEQVLFLDGLARSLAGRLH